MIISSIRTVLLYIIIIFAIRMMGKRQISEMQTSELVITLLMSDIASIPMQDNDQPMLSGIIPIMILLVCEIILSYLMLKSARLRKIVCGKPVIVINDGKIDQNAMKQLRVSTEELYEQLRQKDVFDIEEVAYAIVETNGKLSVYKKAENEPATCTDLKIRKPKNYLQAVVISDGEFADYSLRFCGLSRQQIKKILQKEGIALHDIYIMTADRNGKYNIIKKEV